MTESFDQQMQAKLIALREDLESVTDSAKASADIVELDQARVGRLSRMDALQAQAMSQATERRRQETLRGITSALSRIDNGTFGDCKSCDEPINHKRLAFDPTVALCIDCASKAEQV